MLDVFEGQRVEIYGRSVEKGSRRYIHEMGTCIFFVYDGSSFLNCQGK